MYLLVAGMECAIVCVMVSKHKIDRSFSLIHLAGQRRLISKTSFPFRHALKKISWRIVTRNEVEKEERIKVIIKHRRIVNSQWTKLEN